MEWLNEDALRLIQEYEKRRLLWDPKHKEHYNKIKKNDAWEEIAKVFSIEIDEAKKKMSSLLGSFRRERAKGKKTFGTGKDGRDGYKTNWFAFRSLLFLVDIRDEPRPRATINSETKYDEVSEKTRTTSNDTQNDEVEFENSSQPIEIGEDSADISENAIQINGNSTGTSNADISPTVKEKEKFLKPSTPKRMKNSKLDSRNDRHLQAALHFLQQSDDPTLIYTQHLANKLKQFTGRTRAMIEHAINQIIFEAEMGYYDNLPPQSVGQSSISWDRKSNSLIHVPTPVPSPYVSQDTPWSPHSTSCDSDDSSSAEPNAQPQAHDEIITADEPYVTM